MHQEDTAFYPRGTCQTLLCTWSPGVDLPRCAYGSLVSCLPNGMSPDPTKSSPCLECMPRLANAGPGAPSQPAIKKPQTIIANSQREWCTLSGDMHGIKHLHQRCMGHTLQNNGCMLWALCALRTLVKLVGELLPTRDLAADVSDMHLCRLHAQIHMVTLCRASKPCRQP